MVKFAVIAGSASKDLGKRIARRLKSPYVEAKTRVFPDGESKITFGRIPKNSVVLVVPLHMETLVSLQSVFLGL